MSIIEHRLERVKDVPSYRSILFNTQIHSAHSVKYMKQTVYPSLAYEDAPVAITWLHDTFGFTTEMLIPDADGAVVHAELTVPGGGRFMLLSTTNSTRRTRSPRSHAGTSQSVYVVIEDVDSLYQRVNEHEATIFNPLHDTSYGREFCCLDIEEHIWTFGTYQPDV